MEEDMSDKQGIAENATGEEKIEQLEARVAQGDAYAMGKLSICYRYGKGVNKNLGMSIQLLRKAAELGDYRSMKRLSKCYVTGDGVEKNPDEAERWAAKYVMTKEAAENSPAEIQARRDFYRKARIAFRARKAALESGYLTEAEAKHPSCAKYKEVSENPDRFLRSADGPSKEELAQLAKKVGYTGPLTRTTSVKTILNKAKATRLPGTGLDRRQKLSALQHAELDRLIADGTIKCPRDVMARYPVSYVTAFRFLHKDYAERSREWARHHQAAVRAQGKGGSYDPATWPQRSAQIKAAREALALEAVKGTGLEKLITGDSVPSTQPAPILPASSRSVTPTDQSTAST